MIRTALIAFRDKNGCFPNEKLNVVISLLNGANYSPEEICVIHGEREIFSEVFYKLRQTYDVIIVLDCERNDFEITKAVDDLSINEFSEKDGRFSIALEDNKKGEKALSEVVIPFLSAKSERSFGKVVFKVFGLKKYEIESKFPKLSDGLEVGFNTTGEGLDYKVEIIYDDRSPKMDFDVCQKRFLDEFSNNVYAECDVSIEQRLVDLLKLRRCVLSTAESFTGGNVARSVVSVSGASEVFYEGIVAYDGDAKMKRLGVERSSLVKYKPVSAQVAGEMAKGLLSVGKANVAISTTGIAGPNSDDSNFPVGLCYIGVGFNGKIKVYKYEFDGDRAEVIEKGTKTALFLAIKTLKEI